MTPAQMAILGAEASLASSTQGKIVDGITPSPVPDRLSSSPTSPYFVKDQPLVRISVDGVEYTGRVLEYCISAGWAMVLILDERGEPERGKRGAPSCKTKRGKVVVWLASDPIPEGAIAEGNTAPTVQHVLPNQGLGKSPAI